MTLNCKAGDLAIIVRMPHSDPSALGAIVHVLQLDGPRSYTKVGLSNAEPTWLCEAERPFVCCTGRAAVKFVVPDAFLRPIRGEPDADETPTEIIESLSPKRQLEFAR